MTKTMNSVRRRLLSSKQAIDLLAKVSRPLSPWMPSGILFFHQGRCGSTVLARLLDQHPRLCSFGEIFEQPNQQRRLPAKSENMLRMRRTQAFPSHAIVAVKFFECQHLSLLGRSIAGFVDTVRCSGYEKFIVLNRDNYLRKVVSTEIARERGNKWHYKKNEQVPDTTVHLDVENVRIQGKTASIVELFEYMDEQYRALRTALVGKDVLELTYEEDILDDPRVAYGKVCRWLGVEDVPVQVDLRRTNVLEISKSISNWDEVSRTLTGTPYAWMAQ